MRRITIYILASISFLLSFSIKAEKLQLAGLDGVHNDISSKVLESAYDKLGIQIEVATYPAERALYLSNKGKMDGEIHRIESLHKRYPNLIMIPVPINYFEAMAYTTDDSVKIKNWQHLEPYSIAIKLGIKYAEQGTSGMDVAKYVTYDQIFNLLELERFDIAIASRLEGILHVKRLGSNKIRMLSPSLDSFHLYHYLHRSQLDIVPKVTAVLRSMEENGDIESIRAEYISSLK